MNQIKSTNTDDQLPLDITFFTAISSEPKQDVQITNTLARRPISTCPRKNSLQTKLAWPHLLASWFIAWLLSLRHPLCERE